MSTTHQTARAIDAVALTTLAAHCKAHKLCLLSLTHIDDWPDGNPPQIEGAIWFATLTKSGDMSRGLHGEAYEMLYLENDGSWKDAFEAEES